jgi:hypothetical protein
VLGKGAGLNTGEIESSRRAHSPNLKVAAGLEFAKRIVNQRAMLSDEDLASVRAAGFSAQRPDELPQPGGPNRSGLSEGSAVIRANRLTG